MKIKDKSNYCKVCTNRNMDYDKGLLCGMTNEKPSFKKTCPSFNLDEKNAERLVDRESDIKKIMIDFYTANNEKPEKKKKRFAFFGG
ncbi:MAG: hypothetical protein AAFO69_05915 [Bacteroidota bacterium]